MAVGRPTILIPISISFLGEQLKNAKIAAAWGIAKIIQQDSLTPEVLFNYIENAINSYSSTVEKIKSKKSPDIGASEKLLQILKRYVK